MFHVPQCSCGTAPRRSGQKTCKSCHAKYMREWRSTHRLSGVARIKATARSYAKVYLRRGHLEPKPCEQCGSVEVEMHHDDYNKPLEVRWMCRECHLEHHKLEQVKG